VCGILVPAEERQAWPGPDAELGLGELSVDFRPKTLRLAFLCTIVCHITWQRREKGKPKVC